MNERVRSGMPVNLTQASMTPCISAVMVEPMGVELIRDNNRKQKNMLEEKASTNNCATAFPIKCGLIITMSPMHYNASKQ